MRMRLLLSLRLHQRHPKRRSLPVPVQLQLCLHKRPPMRLTVPLPMLLLLLRLDQRPAMRLTEPVPMPMHLHDGLRGGGADVAIQRHRPTIPQPAVGGHARQRGRTAPRDGS